MTATQNALNLFKTLGYESNKKIELQPNTPVKEVGYLLYTINHDNVNDLRDLAILYSILHLSLRGSEICFLKVSDIKKEGRHWVINYRSKGGVYFI